MDFELLDSIARELMLGRRSHREREIGHVYYHGSRVMNSAIILRKMLTDDASHDELLRAAGLFHDCGKGLEPHDVSGVALVNEFLRDACTADELDEIKRLITHHDRRMNPEDDIWIKILQDADLMDHFGTAEIWLNFNYSACYNRPLSSSLEFYKTEYPRDCAIYRDKLNFDCSKAIFDEKVEFTLEFARRLEIESAGEYAYIPPKADGK